MVKPLRSSKPQKAGFEKNRIVASGLQWALNTASSPLGIIARHEQSHWPHPVEECMGRGLRHASMEAERPSSLLGTVNSLPAPFALHSEDASLFHKSGRNKNKKA